ncbi:hypothetical protein [Butyrivibrio sp. NC2007]|uniref:hypothetical protein n=1 Tax=Butyrivibrio sp. NC2007 TaxID=1280683 RepID=UPI0003B3F86D|nr:hypothetical protein [Butyrivibrio sp. NC2007]
MMNQDNENLIDFDFEMHQQAIDEENEKANPLCLIAIALGIMGLLGGVSGKFIVFVMFMAAGCLTAVITWGIYPKSDFAKRVGIIYICGVILGIIWIVATIMDVLSIFRDGMPF